MLAFFYLADQDAIRILSLLNKVKERNSRKDIYDRAAFTLQMIPTKVTAKDTRLATKTASYIDMIQKDGSVQLSMGSSNTNGLFQFLQEVCSVQDKQRRNTRFHSQGIGANCVEV